jgi:anti-sigma factor RsiW
MTEYHIPDEQLQALLDATLAQDQSGIVLSHLEGCARCRRSMETLRRLNAGLSTLPLEHTSAAFTASLLHSLGIAGSRRRTLSVFENIAYLFALALVLGIVFAVFLWTGVIESAELTEGQSVVQELVGKGQSMIAGAVGSFQQWLGQFFPFVFGNGAMRITIAVVAIAIVLAMVDRAASRRLVERT